MADLLLTVEEAAATLRCGRNRVFELLADGTLVRGARYGRRTVILAESVFAACEAAYHPPAAPAPKRIRGRQGFNAQADAYLAEVRAKYSRRG